MTLDGAIKKNCQQRDDFDELWCDTKAGQPVFSITLKLSDNLKALVICSNVTGTL